ncbi:MAG TPA: efflux RND transporter periplasmic adaptor subunit [Symbiobacteriaceae bacterium]|nr:efflux RND transporter periplasmic adaptor subunit [Symbiobacteriaceae bacterium]
MNNLRKITAAALLAVFALAGCAQKEEAPAIEPVAVAVTEARAGKITATTVASGQVEPILSVYVTAKVPGRVVAIPREMGDKVKAGDLLVELEDRDTANQLTQANANVMQAQAQYAEAERQLTRLRTLFEAGAVSKQQVEQLETQLSLVSAQVTAARATADLARTQWERTRITAPADGVLAARLVEPGAMVGAGTAVFQLVDLSTVVIKTGVAESDVNSVQAGAPVPVTVSALSREFTGKVEAISPNMDRQTRSFQVRVTLANPDGALKGGMFAQVRFAVKEVEGILLPVEAVVERNGESAVFVVDGEKARQQPVKVTVTSGNTVAVEGLTAGTKVAVAGQNRLYDGAPVQVGRSANP